MFIFLFFSFALYYTINGLFFNDTTMHKKYEDHGKYNMIYQIPKIIYSTIISSTINIVVAMLSLTQNDIISCKKQQKNLNNKRKNNSIVDKKYNNYNDYELNNLSYKDALKIDKRNYFQYYFSLLKMKHVIIFTFFTYTDYNSKIIKISLFLFSFTLYFTINALFFTDSTIHKIYEDKGVFNFIYQLPKILYSTAITLVINIIVKYLSLSEKDILRIKEKKQKMKEEIIKLLKNLILKFILFYIIIFLFLILFWYYLSCFCAIYKNTQIHLIKDTAISFGLSLLYPLGINLLPGLFRIPSLKGSREYIYKISKIIQII